MLFSKTNICLLCSLLVGIISELDWHEVKCTMWTSGLKTIYFFAKTKVGLKWYAFLEASVWYYNAPNQSLNLFKRTKIILHKSRLHAFVWKLKSKKYIWTKRSFSVLKPFSCFRINLMNIPGKSGYFMDINLIKQNHFL